MRLRTLLVAGSVLGALGPSGARAASPSAEAVAQALFEQARDDMKRGAYTAACPKLEESQRLDPSNGTLLNLVLCEEAIGKIASAWLRARELSDLLAPDDDRRPIAERKIASLASRLPRLTVRLETSAAGAAQVLLDGTALPPSSIGIPIPIDPGPHTVAVRFPGRPDAVEQVTIGEAEQREWFARPPSQVASDVATPSGLRTPAPDATRPPPGLPTWVPWATLSAGAAALVASGVLAVLTLDRRSTVLRECPQKQCTDPSALETAAEGQRFLVGSLVALGAGVAGEGIGAYLLTRSGSKAHSASPATPPGVVITYGRAF